MNRYGERRTEKQLDVMGHSAVLLRSIQLVPLEQVPYLNLVSLFATDISRRKNDFLCVSQ